MILHKQRVRHSQTCQNEVRKAQILDWKHCRFFLKLPTQHFHPSCCCKEGKNQQEINAVILDTAVWHVHTKSLIPPVGTCTSTDVMAWIVACSCCRTRRKLSNPCHRPITPQHGIARKSWTSCLSMILNCNEATKCATNLCLKFRLPANINKKSSQHKHIAKTLPSWTYSHRGTCDEAIRILCTDGSPEPPFSHWPFSVVEIVPHGATDQTHQDRLVRTIQDQDLAGFVGAKQTAKKNKNSEIWI